MQFKTLAFAFLAAAGASAQLTAIPNSVLLVLATALPESDRSFALASSSEFAAQMASSLAAGNTPAWYQSLPENIKSVLPQLYPPPTPALTTSSAAASTPAISSSPSSGPTGRNSSVISTVSSPTLRSTGAGASSSGSAPPSESTGGAAVPTGVIGAGLAGALGVLGMLAL